MSSIRELIIERFDSMTHLPSFSETLRQVQDELAKKHDSASSSATIGKIIEKDLGLSAKVLKLANSVFYSGRFGQIGDVSHAVARLGVDEVGRLCTLVSSIQMFSETEGTLDLKDFWKHSLGVAIVMRHIALRSSYNIPASHNAYVAGLFHDIGILLLDRYFNQIFQTVLDEGRKKPMPLFELERQILGIDHGELGALVCKKWRLPDDICTAIAWHHTPDTSPEECRKLSQLIHLANYTSSVLGIPEPGDSAIQMGSHGAWHDLGLDTSDLNKIAEDVEEGIARSGVFIALSL